MAKALTIVGGVLKFVCALAIGLVFLTVIQILVLLAVPKLSGLVLPFGLLAVLALSARFAIGEPSRVERAVGVAAAGTTAAVVYSIGMIAGAVFLFGLIGSVVLGMFVAGPGLLHVFAPTGMTAWLIYGLAMFGAVGLIYAATRIWKP